MQLRNHPALRWASLAFIAGGLLMAATWIMFTYAHGPTSFDLDRVVFGRNLFFWGALLGGPPNLLAGLGLALLYPLLAKGASRLAKAGYALTLVGLVVPALMDLFIWGALGPPFFIPLVGLGLILLGFGSRQNPQLSRRNLSLLMLIGIFQVIAFTLALIPLEISDPFGGYRVFGLFAYFFSGLGWALLGVSFWNRSPGLR